MGCASPVQNKKYIIDVLINIYLQLQFIKIFRIIFFVSITWCKRVNYAMLKYFYPLKIVQCVKISCHVKNSLQKFPISIKGRLQTFTVGLYITKVKYSGRCFSDACNDHRFTWMLHRRVFINSAASDHVSRATLWSAGNSTSLPTARCVARSRSIIIMYVPKRVEIKNSVFFINIQSRVCQNHYRYY